MQKVSTKKMTHKEAEEYRHEVQDAVMYQHKNGKIYIVKSPDESFFGLRDYVSDDPNILLIG